MTVTRKLFLAALLLAVGFGVARLMGRPAASWYVPFSSNVASSSVGASAVVQPSRNPEAPPLVANGARLIPDSQTNNPYQIKVDSPPPAAPAPPMPIAAASNALASSAPSPPLVSANEFQLLRPESNPPALSSAEPRATLRDEAPRPIDFESRPLPIVYPQTSAPAPVAGAAAAASDAQSAPANWQASGLSTAGFTQDPSAVGANTATINASYNQPQEISGHASTVAPPPWPELLEESGPRTHIVIDGDSLERLAGRYLDDPTRGNEIYEANRELLASPDLLPIGAELVIPKRSDRSALEGSMPQSSLASDPSMRAASNRSMVPVRPIPSANHVMPRAQLLPPVAAE